MIDMTITELANKLGEALENSAEFIRMKDAERAQDNDAEACEMLLNFNASRESISRRARDGEDVATLRAETQAENEKLMQNEVIAEYLEAMHEFNRLMQSVNGIISSYIAPEGQGCGSGGCAGCSGCGGQDDD